GKTRLAAEVAIRVHDQGGVVLAGRCDEDLGVPYQPFVEALRHFVDHTGAGVLEKRLGRYGGELGRLVPELVERIPDLPAPLISDPETERYRLFDAVASWLSAAAAQDPLLVVVDDLQWAAKPTVLLLRHVLRSSDTRRMLVLGTYRDSELQLDHPLVEVLADLRRQREVERLALVGLDSSGVAAFMEVAAGHALDDDDLRLAGAIHEETEGNPFFVREVLRHLAETGALQQRDGRWISRLPIEELGIPEGVREVVGRRLSVLSGDTNRVLRVAAVVGADFDPSVVEAAIGDVDEEYLLSALEEAIRARLVLEVRGPSVRYRFAHALVRDTLYWGLSAGRRVMLHRRVAEAIESLHIAALDDHLPALAHHWARASAPSADASRAVDYAARAGGRALRQLAHDEAATYFRQALDLLEAAGGAPNKKLELLIDLGEAQRCAGDPAHRRTLLDAGSLAHQLGDTDAAARAALANQRGMFSRYGSVDEERVTALRAAIDAVGPAATVVRARLLAALATELQFAGDARINVGTEALAIARRVGDDSALADVLAAVWLATWGLAPSPERSRLAAELAALAQRLGDRSLEFRATVAMFLTASQHGDVALAQRSLRRCAELAEDLAQPTLRWHATYLRTHWAMSQADLGEAERAALEAGELGEAAGQPDALVITKGPMCVIRLLQGRTTEALELAVTILEHFPGAAVYETIRGWVLAEMGCWQEARSVLEEFRLDGFGRLPLDYSRLCTLVGLARISALLGERLAAAELYELLLPHRDVMATGQVIWIGPVTHDLGLLASALGRYEQAEEHFAEAVRVQDRIGARITSAQSRLEWARTLLTRRDAGDADRARGLLGHALDTARELGLAKVERDAVALLRDCS
ncbi:MAG TPA: AAA family ATPase, partial [Acidimicrobiia bacterium]|nr:AAA family ATPase [Acidimicrobiia bacterium]